MTRIGHGYSGSSLVIPVLLLPFFVVRIWIKLAAETGSGLAVPQSGCDYGLESPNGVSPDESIHYIRSKSQAMCTWGSLSSIQLSLQPQGNGAASPADTQEHVDFPLLLIEIDSILQEALATLERRPELQLQLFIKARPRSVASGLGALEQGAMPRATRRWAIFSVLLQMRRHDAQL